MGVFNRFIYPYLEIKYINNNNNLNNLTPTKT